jgi:hypothetical protein
VSEIVIPIAILYSIADVDLAENRDLIACLMQKIGEEGNVGGQRDVQMLVGQGSRRAGIHARKRGGAGRRAEGVRTKGIAKADALAPNAVMVRSLQNRMSRNRESIGTMPFAKEKDQVRALLSRLRRCLRTAGLRSQKRAGHGKRALQKLAPRCLRTSLLCRRIAHSLGLLSVLVRHSKIS